MKRILLAFIIVFLNLSQILAQNLPPRPEPAQFVNDYADFLSEGERLYLENMLKTYSDSTSNQIVIVSIESLEGYPLETYSLELAQKWGIGQKETDNGILILLSKEERKIRIEVGYGLEDKIPDLFAQHVIDKEMTPKFKEGNFYGGLLDALKALKKALEGSFTAEDLQKQEANKRRFWSRLAIYIPLSILLLIMSVVTKQNRNLRLQKLRNLYLLACSVFVVLIEFFYLPHYQASFLWNAPTAFLALSAYPFFLTFGRRYKAQQLYDQLNHNLYTPKKWDELRQIYFPNEVNAEQKEQQQILKPLTGKARELKALKKLNTRYSQLMHKPDKKLQRRSDADFTELYLSYKVQWRFSDEVFSEKSRQAAQTEIKNYQDTFRPYSLKAMPKEVQNVLVQGIKFLENLREHPEEVLEVNVNWIREKTEDFLDDDKLWGKYKKRYTKKSIEWQRKKLRNSYESLQDTADPQAWYKFYEQSIKKMRSNPGAFLVKKPQNSSSSSRGYSYSSSRGSSSSFSSSSSFGGGSFGGGGASGGW